MDWNAMLKGWRGLALASLAAALLLLAIGEPPHHETGVDAQNYAASALAFLFSPDMLLAYFTAGLLVVAILTHSTFGEQAAIMQRILKRMEESGKLTWAAFVAAHRPEMVISYVRLLPENPAEAADDQPRSVKVGLVNKGESAAIVTGSFAQLSAYYPTDVPHPTEFNAPNNIFEPRPFLVGATDAFEVSTGNDGGLQIGHLEENGKVLYFIGWIVYEDGAIPASTRTYYFCRSCEGEGKPFKTEPFEVTY